MQEILRIEGKEVDVIPNTINRTIQINDLGSAEGRESSYSQTVKLPKTSRNQKVFNFLGVSGNMSTAPYTQLSCDYIVDGIPLIVKGYAEVKATSSYYEIVIYDGVIDLAERLKGKTLSTLDYSDLNHYLSRDNYLGSFTNTEGYIYALGRFIDDGSSTIRVERQVPSIYTHTLWDKVFSELGVNYVGDFFLNNQDFRTEVVTPPQGYEVEDIQTSLDNVGTYQTHVVSDFEFSSSPIYVSYQRLPFDTTFIDSRTSVGSNDVITFNKTMGTQISIDIDYTSLEGYNSFRAVFNGETLKSKQLTEGNSPINITLNLSVNVGDELYFEVSGADTLEDEIGKYSVDYSASAYITIKESTGGFLINFNQMMGDLPQLDFIKDVMQRYGLVLRPTEGADTYEFIQFEELLGDKNNAEDWSDKLDTITNEQYGIPYARENKATYSYHEDIVVPTYDGILTVNNENLEAEKSLFESPYEIPTTGIYYSNNIMYFHPVWETEEEDGNEVVKVKESPIKTFRVNRLSRSLTAHYFNDATTIDFTGEIPFLSLNNMGMQYFLDNYYSAYNSVINKYKEVDITLNLSLIDVHDLDLFKLKYLKQTGKYYYLNKIKHSAGGEISSGVLIEINDFI